MTLEKLLAFDSIGRTDDGARPALQMRYHPVADRLEIAGEIELGDAFAIAGIRPQLLVRLRNHHAHDLGGFTGGFWRGFDDIHHDRLLRDHFLRRLVLAQALECGLPDIAALGKAGEFDFGDQFRFQPVDVAALARRVLAAERALVGLGFLEHRHDAPNRVLPEASPDDADKGQAIVAIEAGHQRAEFAVGGLPAAEHDFLSGARFDLGPAFGTPGAIGRAEFLGNDAFEL